MSEIDEAAEAWVSSHCKTLSQGVAARLAFQAGAAWAKTQAEAEGEAKELEIEKLRLQLVGCGVAAQCNTRESLKSQLIERENDYWSASYGDVIAAVEREINLREQLTAEKARSKELEERLLKYEK